MATLHTMSFLSRGHGEVSLEYIGGGTLYISGRILCGAGAEQHQAAIDGSSLLHVAFQQANY